MLGGEGRARRGTGHLLLSIVANHTPNRNNTRPMPGHQRRLLQAFWSLLGEVLQCVCECQEYTLDLCYFLFKNIFYKFLHLNVHVDAMGT